VERRAGGGRDRARDDGQGVTPRAAALVVAVALGLPTAIAARAEEGGAIPDPARMAALRDAVRRAPVLLVRGDFGLRELRDARLDSSGVRSAQQESAKRPRPALLATADAPSTALSPIIPWSEISSLETQRPKKLQGAVAGFVVGLTVGTTLALEHEDTYSGEDYTGVALLAGSPVLGILLGTLVGSLSGTKVIYRAPIQETP